MVLPSSRSLKFKYLMAQVWWYIKIQQGYKMNKETEEVNIGELLLNFNLAKSRSDIFDFLYELNYDDDLI